MPYIAKMVNVEKADGGSLLGGEVRGLPLSLDMETMAKLGLDQNEAEVGSELHLFALAKVVAIHKHDDAMQGPRCCIDLEITDIAIESEDAENAEMMGKAEEHGWYDDGGAQ